MAMPSRRCVILALTATVLSAAAALAQSERPKIGLALSGGGAKGGAHVGVLKVLEELNVPVDYIAGTSMGAIVGGLYASGMSIEDLERTIETIDWDDILSDKTRRRDLAFRRKEEDARFLIPIEAGIGRGGFKWPAGLLQGQKLYFLLQSLTLPVAHVDDFDELPIPFRCVATDISTGGMVVLGGGNLATALRASMAIPTVFSPVELDGLLLVDGGLTRNLPVDVALEMGADVVIAVDVSEPLIGQKVESLVQVYSQTMRMLTRVNVESQLELADLVVSPPVTGFSTMDFASIEQIVRLGEDEARAMEVELSRYSVAPAEYDQLAAAALPRIHPEVIGEVRFEGNERVDGRIIEPLLRVQSGDPMNLDDVGQDLLRIYGLADFESVTFSLDSEEPRDLTLHLREKPWGPNYVHFNFSFSSVLDGDTAVGLLANVTSRPLNSLGAEWRNTLVVGRDSLLSSEFYQPFDFRGRWFFAPRLNLGRRRLFFYEDLRSLAELEVLTGEAAIDFGYQFGNFGQVRLGARRGLVDVSVDSGDLPGDVVDQIRDGIDLAGVEGSAVFDRLDSATFPSRGGSSIVQAFYSLESFGASEEYARWQAKVNQFFTFGGRHTVLLAVQGGWSPGGELPVYEEFTLGGFLSLSGFARDQLRGQYFGVGRAGYYTRLGGLYLGGYFEAGNTWSTSSDADFDSLIGAGTLFLGKDTRLGPLYLAYGVAEDSHRSFYIVFGRTF